MDLNQQRLNLAGTRGFNAPGAGLARRAAMAELSRDWIGEIWTAATHGARVDGGRPGQRRQPGTRRLRTAQRLRPRAVARRPLNVEARRSPPWPTASGTRSQDGGAKLDHSVRTVAECRSVAAGDLSGRRRSAGSGAVGRRRTGGGGDTINVRYDWRANARRGCRNWSSRSGRHERHGTWRRPSNQT